MIATGRWLVTAFCDDVPERHGGRFASILGGLEFCLAEMLVDIA